MRSRSSSCDSSLFEGSDSWLDTPVMPLKDGLTVNDFLQNRQTEFEVVLDQDNDSEERRNLTSAEASSNFDDLKEFVNLDMVDVDDAEEGATPFDKFHSKMTNVTEDGKVKKYVVKQSVGPLVPADSVVYIRYQGYIEYQEVPFDSTFMHNEEKDVPQAFNLASKELLVGLELAILSMRKGEKSEFLIHPDLAFGKRGCPPRIPPDATVMFVVELDRFIDCAEANLNKDDLTNEERHQFKNVQKKAKAYYLLGNDSFRSDKIQVAVSNYRKAINMLHNARLKDEAEEFERNHFLVKLYTNSCVCYHKLKNPKKVCTMASDAVRVHEAEVFKNSKLLYFWGFAKMTLGDFDCAQKFLTKAKNLQPQDPDITRALQDLSKKRQQALLAEKLMYQRAINCQPKASTVKITEIVDEEEESLRATIKQALLDLKERPNSEQLHKKGLLLKEEKLWMDTAKEVGLYARVVVANDGKRIVHIKKPDHDHM